MENIAVIIAMLLLCINASDKKLLLLIAGSCGLLELVYMADMDIALYYGVSSMISIVTALMSVTKIKYTSAKVLAVLMLAQAIICLCLIPDWSYTTNEELQFKLSQFNDMLIFILIGLGVVSSDRCGNNC